MQRQERPCLGPNGGMLQKNLAVLLGRQGTAQIHRTSDPLAYATVRLAAGLRAHHGHRQHSHAGDTLPHLFAIRNLRGGGQVWSGMR
jgi:hypothetical protein